MNSTTNRYSCRLSSVSLMLFFPALLFFVLGLGTSALALSDNSPGIVIKTYSGMDYKRAHGYWRSKVCAFWMSCHLKNWTLIEKSPWASCCGIYRPQWRWSIEVVSRQSRCIQRGSHLCADKDSRRISCQCFTPIWKPSLLIEVL